MAEPAANQLPILPDEPVDPISPADMNTMMIAHGASIFPNTMRWLWRDYPC